MGCRCKVAAHFSGLFPVFSCVLVLKWLIINTIHFSDSLRIKLWLLKGLQVFSGGFCLGHDFWILVFFSFGLCGCCGFAVILWFFRARMRARAEGQPKGLCFRFHFRCFHVF